MPKDITNDDGRLDTTPTTQLRALRRIFTSVDLECDNIEEILEYRTGKIVVRFGGKRGVTYLELR